MAAAPPRAVTAAVVPPAVPRARSLSERWGAVRLTVAIFARRLRYRIAVRLVKPSDGMIASRAIYLQGMTDLADLSNWVDRAGLLKGQPKKFRLLEAKIGNITTAFVDAMHIGEPSLQWPEIQQLYVAARMRGLSRREKERLNLLQSVQQLGGRIGKKVKNAAGIPGHAPASPVGPDPREAVAAVGGNAGGDPKAAAPQLAEVAA